MKLLDRENRELRRRRMRDNLTSGSMRVRLEPEF